MNIPKVSIIIVTWNSQYYICDALESIMSQTFRDFSVIIIDNNSMDDTIGLVKKHFPSAYVIKNIKNFGYSKANNIGIKLSKSEYVLIMNPDIILENNFLKNLVDFADKHEEAGSFCGKLFKLEKENHQIAERSDGLHYAKKSTIIDSVGIIMQKNRNAINRGEGQENSEIYNENAKVFGAPGCLALFRKKALLDVEIFNEYFDEIFFAYKEDVDLAWRLLLYGWESWFVTDAHAYHERYFQSIGGNSILQYIRSRKKISKKLRFLSLRNQYLMIIKNEHLKNFLLYSPRIVLKSMQNLLLIIFVEPFLIKVFFDLPKLFIIFLRKRKIIMSRSKMTSKEIKKWFI